MTHKSLSNHTIIVTGFGGSSLVMQMLEAGGVPVTGEYPAFEHELGSPLRRSRSRER